LGKKPGKSFRQYFEQMHVLDLSKFSHEFIGARAIHRYASFLVAFDSRSSLTSVVNFFLEYAGGLRIIALR